MTLDDTLWDILDTIKLGEFFDRHNIPPVVFPIAIIAIIAVVFFLLLSPGGPSNVCVVDGMCNPPENATNCPQDCNLTVTPTTKTIKVYVRGGSDALADVTLKISDEKHNSMFSRGVHENVNMAAIFAFINGLNRLLQK